MTAAKASVFYGELANTFSLLKAARSHQLVESQLLGIDLILRRQAKGTLSSRNRAIGRLPVEIWSLIKDELHAQSLVGVIRSWAHDYIDWAEMKSSDVTSLGSSDEGFTDAQVKEDSRVEKAIKQCRNAARKILMSSDWEEWTQREDFEMYGWTQYDSQPEQLVFMASALLDGTTLESEIVPFLAKFGLRRVSKTFNANGDAKNDSICDLYLPISLQVAHPAVKDGLNLSPSLDNGYACKTVQLSSINEDAARSPFKILFERYHVEFAPLDNKGLIKKRKGGSGKVEGKNKKKKAVKDKVQPPNPSWRLYCGLWTEVDDQ